jgi:hypothetical protein
MKNVATKSAPKQSRAATEVLVHYLAGVAVEAVEMGLQIAAASGHGDTHKVLEMVAESIAATGVDVAIAKRATRLALVRSAAAKGIDLTAQAKTFFPEIAA